MASTYYYSQQYPQYQQPSGYPIQQTQQPRQATSYPYSNPASCGQQQCVSQQSPRSPSQYLCLHPQCARTLTGFGRYADLERHIAIVHNRSTLQLVDCTYPGCHRRGEYGFTRKDKMVEHLRDVHKADIPKRARGKSNSP